MRPAPRCQLLLESGQWTPVGGPPSSARLISRALCRYVYFDPPQALTPQQLARAARTFAEASAPYPDAGMILLRWPRGAGVWYWDKGRFGAAVGAGRVLPESIWRQPGEGWRIIACAEGYEAQYWEDGGLRAATWRRTLFSPQQWAAFALSVNKPKLEAPDAPPAAATLPMVSAQWRKIEIKAPPGWRDLQNGALAVSLCAAALSTFFAGQALHYDSQRRAEENARAEVFSHMRGDDNITRMRANVELIDSFRRVADGVNVLGATAAAFGVFTQANIVVHDWSVDEREFRAVIDRPQGPMRELLGALEAAPELCVARPEIIAGGQRAEVRVTLASDGCVQGGAP